MSLRGWRIKRRARRAAPVCLHGGEEAVSIAMHSPPQLARALGGINPGLLPARALPRGGRIQALTPTGANSTEWPYACLPPLPQPVSSRPRRAVSLPPCFGDDSVILQDSTSVAPLLQHLHPAESPSTEALPCNRAAYQTRPCVLMSESLGWKLSTARWLRVSILSCSAHEPEDTNE